MFTENFRLLKPDILPLITTVDIKVLTDYYNEICIITDLSDKNYEKEISSPYTTIIKATYFYDYYIEKYNVSDKEWLTFILKVNTLVWKLDTDEIYVIQSKIEKISNEYFSSVIDKNSPISQDFIDNVEIEIEEWTTDLELVTTLFNSITFKVLDDNISTKALILEIIIDWITKWDTKEEIIFRISNLSEIYGH